MFEMVLLSLSLACVCGLEPRISSLAVKTQNWHWHLCHLTELHSSLFMQAF